MPIHVLKPLGLRRWLFSLALSALVPALLFSGYVLFEFDRAARVALLHSLEHRAHSLQQSLEQMIKVATTSVSVLANSESAQSGDWQGLYNQAKRWVSQDGSVRAVTLIDGNGDLLFHTGMPFGAPLFKANDMASVEAALQSGRISVSGAFKAPVSPKSVVAVTVPLRQRGQVTHVLRAIILTESVDRLLVGASLPDGWVAGVADARGTLLARSSGSEAFVGKPAAPSFFEGMRRGDGRPFQGNTLEGVLTAIVVLPVQGGDWYVGVAVPQSVLSASLDQSIMQLAGFAVLWFAIAFGLSYGFGNYIIRQARALVDSVKAAPARAQAQAPLRVKEFIDLLGGVVAVKHREVEATERMITAQAQRDEVFDLYERAPCGYHSLDGQGCFVRMNATELGWLGYRWEEVQGRAMTDLLTPESNVRFAEAFPKFLQAGHIEDVELVLVRKDGSTFPASISATALKDAQGNFLSTRTTVFDITERKNLEARLEQLARTDALTGLSNRRDFIERGEREWQRHQRHAAPLAVLMMDIDHFKSINDQHGHAGGDLVLKAMAKTCAAALRNIDLVARVGGEEFAVMLPATAIEPATEVAERLRQAVESLSVPLPDGQEVRFTVSVGLAMYEPADEGIDAGLMRADQALYKAKAGGRNQVQAASPQVALGTPA
jgi:diguanylate cyclase (GGDEF)-like protein/PAS domain S-box-containing protein